MLVWSMFMVNSYVRGCICTHVVDKRHVGYLLSPFILFLQTEALTDTSLVSVSSFPSFTLLLSPSFLLLFLFFTPPPFFSFEIILNSHGNVPNKKSPGSFYLASSKDDIPFFPFKLYLTYS